MRARFPGNFSQLDPFFKPNSVAIVGASDGKGKVGRLFMERFLEAGFQKLYPINTREAEVLGISAYKKITDVPGTVDLALVLVPPKSVLDVVKECTAKGVKGIVVVTAKIGEEGVEQEHEAVRVAREAGCRVVGPNCLGIYCPEFRLPFSLGPGMEAGDVGIVSQSGSFADILTKVGTAHGVKFSKAISCGNECDLHAVDFLEYLGNDPETRIILAYFEGTKDGHRLNQVIREVTRVKPVILWKCGITPEGRRAATSHTGSLAGVRRIWEGLLNGAGVIRVHSIEETLDCLYAFNSQPLPKGRRIAIISGPGGPAVGTVDTCVNLGLEVPGLTMATKEALRKIIPSFGTSVENPVDLSFSTILNPGVYGEVIQLLASEEHIDMVLVISYGGEHFIKAIDRVRRYSNKPLAVSLLGPLESIAGDFKFLLQNGVPAYLDPARAAKSLAWLARYAVFAEVRT